MAQYPLADQVAGLAEPLAASLGLRLWGVDVALGKSGVVRVFVENVSKGAPEPALPETVEMAAEGGVGIEQCAALSRLLSLALDVDDIIPDSYILEVSSPGLDRTFFTAAQLAEARGKMVEITLNQPPAAMPGRRKFRGVLTDAPEPEGGVIPADAVFSLRADDASRSGLQAPLIPFVFADLKKAKLVHTVPEKVLPGKGKKRPDGSNAPGGVSPESDTDG